MALLQLGLALGAYAGQRVVEGGQRPRRLRRHLRERGAGGTGQSPAAADAADILLRRRADARAGSWAVALCLGSYAVPVLTPAALAVTIYSMLPLLRAGERALVRDGRVGDDAVNVAVCEAGAGLGQPPDWTLIGDYLDLFGLGEQIARLEDWYGQAQRR